MYKSTRKLWNHDHMLLLCKLCMIEIVFEYWPILWHSTWPLPTLYPQYMPTFQMWGLRSVAKFQVYKANRTAEITFFVGYLVGDSDISVHRIFRFDCPSVIDLSNIYMIHAYCILRVLLVRLAMYCTHCCVGLVRILKIGCWFIFIIPLCFAIPRFFPQSPLFTAW